MDTEEYKPTLYISEKDLPEIKSWKIGEEYEIVVRVRQKSISESPSKQISGSFEVIEMMVPESDKSIDEMDDNEFNAYASDKKRNEY